MKSRFRSQEYMGSLRPERVGQRISGTSLRWIVFYGEEITMTWEEAPATDIGHIESSNGVNISYIIVYYQ